MRDNALTLLHPPTLAPIIFFNISIYLPPRCMYFIADPDMFIESLHIWLSLLVLILGEKPLIGYQTPYLKVDQDLPTNCRFEML